MKSNDQKIQLEVYLEEDPETGELFEVTKLPLKSPKSVKFTPKALIHFAHNPIFKRFSSAMWWSILSYTDKDNVIRASNVQIARRLGVNSSHVARVMKMLLEAQVIYKKPAEKHYHLRKAFIESQS